MAARLVAVFRLSVNYPPLARAEVGASGQQSLVTTPAKPGSYQRPSFFLPTKNYV